MLLRDLPILVAILVLLATLPSLAASTRPVANPREALWKLFDREWDKELERNPIWASMLGDRRWNDQWGDHTLDAISAAGSTWQAALDELHAIPRSRLSVEDQLNYDLFERHLSEKLEGLKYRDFLMPVNQLAGIQTTSDHARNLRFATFQDYEDWLARLDRFPAYMDQVISLMKQGIAEHRLPPRLIMDRVLPQVERQFVADPEDSPFWEPFEHVAEHVSPEQADTIRLQARTAIQDRVIPAFRGFRQFLASEYLPACPEKPGAAHLPDGAAYYAFMVRRETTTAMTPREIHDLGQREVARIEGEMHRVMRDTGFEGDLPAFFQYLRTDPKFYFDSSEELLEGYRALAKKIDPLLVPLFGTLPRTPYGVDAVPAISAPDSPVAYYDEPAGDGSRAGMFRVNLYRPDLRPRYDMVALTLHEAMPGHHLQIALAAERTDLPRFRKFGGWTAYIEGWGLYAESLGDEMHLYDNPYAKFGQLTLEQWRAVRLVVDTGIHALGWTRQQAIQYFRDHSPKTDLDITNEVDRYISWPAQALSYKVGELELKRLRQHACEKLGARFDLRAFHDLVLRQGAIPLDLLASIVDRWIAAGGPAEPADKPGN